MTGRVALLSLFLAALAPPRADAQTLADAQGRREAIEFFRTGQQLMSGEQFERAADAFSKAVEKDAFLTVAHYQLGQAYMNLQRYARAIEAFKGCIDLTRKLHDMEQTNRFEVDKQRDDEIRALRTVISDMKMDALRRTQYEQQLHDLENRRTSTGVAFRPPAEVLLALGSAYFRSGDRETAELEWKAAAQANPKLGEAHNNLAASYMQTGRLDEAEQSLKLAEKAGFRVNPQFKEDLKKRKAAR